MNSPIYSITRNKQVLHFDEQPVLWSGKNRIGQNIIVSLAEDNIEENILTYLHSIVDLKILQHFVDGKISYLQVLNDAIGIFVVSKDINDNIIRSRFVAFENVPKYYLPSENSYLKK